MYRECKKKKTKKICSKTLSDIIYLCCVLKCYVNALFVQLYTNLFLFIYYLFCFFNIPY